MSALRVGDIVESLIDDTFAINSTTYKTLIKGHQYKITTILPQKQASNNIELEPIGEPNVFVYAKASELKLVSEGVAA